MEAGLMKEVFIN